MGGEVDKKNFEINYPWFGVNPLNKAIKDPLAIVLIRQQEADEWIQETRFCYTPQEQIKVSSGSYQFLHSALQYIMQV